MAKKKKTTKNWFRMETSKMIILASYVITILLTIIVVIGSFSGFDMEHVTAITVLSYGECAASNVWYFKKAAKENVPKIISGFPKELQEQIDINQLLNQD